MVKLERILVLGGGIGGMCAAIALARKGYHVDLCEAQSELSAQGSGLTLMGPALRALHKLGVWPAVRDAGNFATGSRILDAQGKVIVERDGHRLPGLDLPTAGGILRPVLHDILANRLREVGILTHVGLAASELLQSADDVEVRYVDGSSSRHDLVVAADGLMSSTRRTLWPEAVKPAFTGQGCWRLIAERPASIDRPTFYVGAPVTVGAVPCSPTHMYVWVLQHVPDNPWVDPAAQPALLRELLEPFGGDLVEVRQNIGPQSNVNYRPLEAFLMEAPWHKGRVVLLGDAAHGTTPHLASGAGMAMEDALVLADSLSTHETLDAALTAHTQRRVPRCTLVVKNSVAIGDAEMRHEPAATLNEIMTRSHKALVEMY
ncbi:FAD-dependent monooxygenase [Sphaerotilus sp.]|uniref:FAD-dependent monooxygenase n=1 Tax=Sphaerotilus sp. TaxID=2093942 RepID=UPI00286E3BB6|nr:FAD-dependent monooxygenase [Sphaerotilus sp.]